MQLRSEARIFRRFLMITISKLREIFPKFYWFFVAHERNLRISFRKVSTKIGLTQNIIGNSQTLRMRKFVKDFRKEGNFLIFGHISIKNYCEMK